MAVWYARQDLNLRPSESESDALSTAPRAHMFDLRRLAWVCFFAFGGQTVVKGVSLFCFRCPQCQCLQPLADFRYSTRRVCRSLTLYPAELRAHIEFDLRCLSKCSETSGRRQGKNVYKRRKICYNIWRISDLIYLSFAALDIIANLRLKVNSRVQLFFYAA